ncbi:MAG: alcohol dehydrogenase [Alphaproteobacteria bacterium]
MAKMRAVQVPSAGADFELVERDVPEPGPRQVRIRVEACGICHSDQIIKDGLFPGITYPRIPGHEISGIVDRLGPEVAGWKVGDKVGVGWHGGHCFVCRACRKGDFVHCENQDITGLSVDGGYAEYAIVRQEALAHRPGELSAAEAAPLCCAGITVFNALRNAGAQPGDTVAVLGVGGLGHLAIQFAARQGYRVIAISGSADKQNLARTLGAHHYIDTSREDMAEALMKLGGAEVILGTAPDVAPLTAAVGGLGRRGRLLILGVSAGNMEISPVHMVMGSRSVAGWASGSAVDSEDTLNFSALTGVRPMVETFPLKDVAAAYQHMMDNRARFRVVLEI